MDIPYVYKETLLKIDNICLEYDGRPILRNLCAEIKDVYIPGRVTGQIVALLGPSGRGRASDLPYSIWTPAPEFWSSSFG